MLICMLNRSFKSSCCNDFYFFLDGGPGQELGTQTPVFEDKQFKRRIAILQKLQDKYQKLGPEEQEKVRQVDKENILFSPNMKIC